MKLGSVLIRGLCKLLAHLFFATLRVHDGHRLPRDGPVLIVSNHHSSLVDPVALIATMPRTPRFLAKAALWSAAYLPLRPLLAMAGAIPVHRSRDGGGDNSGMFNACHDALQAGSVIALFGEGISHSLPGLVDLKTGAARIALGSGVPLHVVPVGLIYDDRATYRSRAQAYVGEPIAVQGSVGGDEDRGAVRALTEQIRAGLDLVAPTWSTWAMHDRARIAARLLTASDPHAEVAASLTALNRAVDEERPEAAELLTAVSDLEREVERLDLDMETVIEQPRSSIDRLDRVSLLKTLLWAPFAIAGRVLNAPPFGLIGRLAARQNMDFQATTKILLGVFLFPLWWLVLGLATGWLLGTVVGIAVGIAVPILGYLSARKMARLRRFQHRAELRAAVSPEDGTALRALRDRVIERATPIALDLT